MIRSIVQNAISLSLLSPTTSEHFVETSSKRNAGYLILQIAVSIVTIVIILILLGFIGVFLWNNFIAGRGPDATGLFTFIKPATNIWQIIGLYLFILLISPQ